MIALCDGAMDREELRASSGVMSHACRIAEREEWSEVGRARGSSGDGWKDIVGPLNVGVIIITGGLICIAVGAWSNHRAQSSGQPELNSIGGWFLERFGAVSIVVGVVLLVCAGIVRGYRTRR